MVILKSPKEIEKIRESNQIVAEILSILKTEIKPGVDTLYLNDLAEKLTKKKKLYRHLKGIEVFHIQFVHLLIRWLFTVFHQSGPLMKVIF
jgi:methionyl aminopeptidase